MQVREGTQVSEGPAKPLALKGTIARLTAESTSRALSIPYDVTAADRMAEDETDSYQARKYALDEAVQSDQRSIALVMRELNVARSIASPSPTAVRLAVAAGAFRSQHHYPTASPSIRQSNAIQGPGQARPAAGADHPTNNNKQTQGASS
ncbi:MAG TPA: hypothetical protein VFL86_13275 [Burkholderiaceae bacterium]|nr:hypothetical protein [Burkholderiaceae bacterium]